VLWYIDMTPPTNPDLPTRPAGSSADTIPQGSLADTGVGPGATPASPPPAGLEPVGPGAVPVSPPPAGPPPSGSPPMGPTPPAGPPVSGPPVSGPQPGYSIALLVSVFVLALIGIGLLGAAIFAVARLTNSPGAGAAVATATRIPLPTQAVVIPTTTPLPPTTPTNTPAPTQTAVPATNTPAATAATTATVAVTATVNATLATVVTGANVRSGPGVAYPSIGSLKVGDTAPLVGRDVSAGWLVISFKAAAQGQGWISSQLVSFSGDAHSLPVVAAPSPPLQAPTATAAPSGNPIGGLVTGAHGVSGNLRLCSSQFSYAVGEYICFVEWIKNNTAQRVGYGVLGVQAVNLAGGAQFHTSWDGAKLPGGLFGIDPGCIGPIENCKGEWQDGMRLNAPGPYQLTLNVCFSGYTVCPTHDGVWEVLSGAIRISVN
jgi:uncharacterized protein YraI